MNKDKQISEIAKILVEYEDCGDCQKCKYHNSCGEERIATNLYEAGYRKQSEVAREIFEEIEHAIDYAEIEWGTIFGVKCSIAAVKKKYTDGAKTKEIGKFVAPKVVQLTIDDMENNQ